MKLIVIYGTGYMEIVKLIDAINCFKPTYKIIGFINDLLEFQGKTFMGYSVLGSKKIIPQLVTQKNVCFFNNINSSLKNRKKIASIFEENGCEVTSLIHPSVDLNYVEYNIGCIVPAGCTIGTNTKIGRYLTCRLNSLVSHDVTIKDFVFIGPGVTCSGYSTLEKGCFIGAGATILGGVTVGAGSVIGAGSTVLNDIPRNVIAYGVPAKVIRRIDSEEYRGKGM